VGIKELAEADLRPTEFEERRGITRISVELGYVQVHISRIPAESLDQERFTVLSLIAGVGINMRFPKLTPSGLLFLVREENACLLNKCLERWGKHSSIKTRRCIVSVHAASMREDDGLIARIAGEALASGVHIDLVSDTHDQTMLVVDESDATPLLGRLNTLMGGPSLRVHPHKCLRGRRIKVIKFGGTSMETAEARKRAAEIVVSAISEGFLPVVVVSAIGRKGLPYATDTLIGQLEEVDPTTPPAPRELDLMLACGEIFSAVIFAHTLTAMGYSAHAFRGDQAGIETDGEFGRARIIGIHPSHVSKALRAGTIPVVCGFQGAAKGEVTTLGRGGSDTTASAMGAALGADAVEIYTDVDGVMNADPRLVREAETLRQTTYDEVAAMAHLGAKVVHPRAAEIAMSYETPLWVKNTFSKDPGTEIVPETRFPGRRRTGVTHTGKLVYFQLDLSDVDSAERAAVSALIYRRLGEFGINVFMVNLSPTSTGFAVPASNILLVNGLLAGLGQRTNFRVAVRVCCTMVSLVGREYIETPGLLNRCLDALSELNVDVFQTSDGDRSLSYLVPEEHGAVAVECLFQVHKS